MNNDFKIEVKEKKFVCVCDTVFLINLSEICHTCRIRCNKNIVTKIISFLVLIVSLVAVNSL